MSTKCDSQYKVADTSYTGKEVAQPFQKWLGEL